VQLLPPEKAAQMVLDGVARKQMVIAFPAYVHRLAFLHRSRPASFMRMALAQVAHFRKIERPDAGAPPEPCPTLRPM
jgi:hypothetical protein